MARSAMTRGHASAVVMTQSTNHAYNKKHLNYNTVFCCRSSVSKTRHVTPQTSHFVSAHEHSRSCSCYIMWADFVES